MRTSDSDLLLVPGLAGADPDHWLTRWGTKLTTAQFVEPFSADPLHPAEWTERIVAAVQAATRPVVILAHGLGSVATVHATPACPGGIVRGAFLVAPVDVERPDMEAHLHAFSPLPRATLPFPSLLVASRNDPLCDYDRADSFATDWGSTLVDAGEAGSLDGASGHGPWPEGLMRLAGFMRDV